LQDSFDAGDSNLFKLGAENIFLGRTAATKKKRSVLPASNW
jgi:PTS system mannitol-specific IIC component